MPLTKVAQHPEPPTVEKKLEDRRLWIGNLDPHISEYQLLKILEKHGHLEKFDLLFHRTGPLAGQPRGYAFVTFSSSDDAKKVKEIIDGSLIGSKPVAVRWANKESVDEKDKQKINLEIPALTGAKTEKGVSRSTKIQAIEAKLKMMEKCSNNEFKLNDGPSCISNNIHCNITRGRLSRSRPSINRTKYFRSLKPYHRR